MLVPDCCYPLHDSIKSLEYQSLHNPMELSNSASWYLFQFSFGLNLSLSQFLIVLGIEVELLISMFLTNSEYLQNMQLYQTVCYLKTCSVSNLQTERQKKRDFGSRMCIFCY